MAAVQHEWVTRSMVHGVLLLSHPKSVTEGTSGPTIWTSVQQFFFVNLISFLGGKIFYRGNSYGIIEGNTTA